ncbi:Uncharacterised protein [Moellerella wisconsensis]|nr:Uncharacterised protein [Moellerella wisconsensis]
MKLAKQITIGGGIYCRGSGGDPVCSLSAGGKLWA